MKKKKDLVISSFLLKFIRNAKCLYAKYINCTWKKWFGDSFPGGDICVYLD